MSNRDSKEHFNIPAAIGYSPDRNESLPLASQPRPPRNLQDLLRYSTEAANALGETGSANATAPLDDESKKFLENAMNSMTTDVIEELSKCIKILQNACTLPEDGDPTEFENALDSIFDFVDNLDVANDFHKIGGFCVFKSCLESTHSSLRWRGAELIAELCQNNPYCQSKVLKTGLMSSLLKMIDADINDKVKIKALYAVSCMVRDNDEGFKEFVDRDGFSVLLRALQTNLEKLNIKSAFLLTSLCHWKPHIKDDLINMGYVEQLISQLGILVQMSNEGHPPCSEHLLRAILDIVNDHRSAQEISRRPELQFKSLLDEIIKNSEDNDQYKEENDYAKRLIRIIFCEAEIWDEER